MQDSFILLVKVSYSKRKRAKKEATKPLGQVASL